MRSASTPPAAEPVTLKSLGEQMHRMFTELRTELRVVQQHIGTIDNEMLIQSSIMTRLEQRQLEPLTAIHQQLIRFERRLRALENK